MEIRKNLLVRMQDGTRLALDVFLPDGEGPWPVVLAAYPYHKDGQVGFGCMLEILSYTGAGYAFVLADLRGTGSSEGVTQDPFDPLRGDDLCALVEWCGDQEWSTGRVGMTGQSYGGMTSLKAASESPPSLKAIVPVMAPIFFYENLAFPGGSLNMLGLCGAWLNFMNVMNLLPPLYTEGRQDWEALWRARLEAYTPYVFGALEHTTYDAYWEGADLPVEDIEVPTYIIEGWRGFSHRDGLRAFLALKGPKKILVGPWVHVSPTLALAEPFSHAQEAIRWFDYWLKGLENGILDEPPVSVRVLGSGSWRQERLWPPEASSEKRFYLHGSGRLAEARDTSGTALEYGHEPAVGTSAGLMTVYPLGIDYPRDQREDDARSLLFDTPPLSEDLEIVGEALLTLTVSTDMPDAAVTAKLCDVSPDGASRFITSGWLRLSHRAGSRDPKPPLPGEACHIEVPLWPIDYLVPAGHRLRLAVSLSDFPRLFPLPYRGGIRLAFGPGETQELSLRTVPPETRQEGSPPPGLVPPDLSVLKGVPFAYEPCWKVTKDYVNNRVSVESGMSMEFRPMHLAEPIRTANHYSASVTEGCPETAILEAHAEVTFSPDGVGYTAKVNQRMTCNQIEISVRVDRQGETIHERSYSRPYKA